MGGRGRVAAAVLGVVAIVVVVALVASGGNSKKQTASTPAATQPTTTQPAKTQPPARHRSKRSHRQGVIRGGPNKPDEPAPGTGPLLAIADQKPQTFSDPNFRALGVARSRLNTPWNSIFTEPARLGAWLTAARAAGIEPLIAFEHERGDNCPAQPCRLPPLNAYTRAVAAFHQHYPWVHLLEPWNEASSSTQPTGYHPEAAAQYYEAVRKVCPGCIVPAADVLGGGNLARWLARFRAALHGPTPQLWGLHNYSDTNRFRDSDTRQMLSLVPGEVWLTETGGIVSFTTAAGRTALSDDEQRAARATSYLLGHLAHLSRRITRIYIYQWKIDFPGNRFDAGLVDQNGNPRPALKVVRRYLTLLR